MLTTKEFSEVTGVPVGTLKRWRSKPRGSCEGRQGVLVPAVVDKRGRCFYTDAQIDIARQLHNPHYGQPKLFEEMTHMPTNETATADNTAYDAQNDAHAANQAVDDQTPADAQNTVKIDDEFKNLIPPLADDEFQQLEENILRDGIQDSLKTWRGILIDGHNRYQIAQKHGLPFKVTEMEFADRDAVKMWIVQNQFGRRNVNRFSRGELALKLEPSIAAQAKANQVRKSADFVSSTLTVQTPIDTRTELAKIAGVSTGTMTKIKYLVEHAADEIKIALRADKLTINSAFNGVKAGAKTVADIEMFKGYSHVEPALQLEAAITDRAKENLSTHTADGYQQRLANVPKGESNDPPCAEPARNDESTDDDQQATVVEVQDEPTNDENSTCEVVGGQVNRICDNKVAGIVTLDDANDIADVGNQNVPAQVVTDGEDTVQHDDRDAVKTLLDRVAELILRADDDALIIAHGTLAGLVATLEKKCPPLTPTGNQ